MGTEGDELCHAVLKGTNSPMGTQRGPTPHGFIIGALAGLVVGVVLSTGVATYSQQPEWYRDTLQGQYSQRMQIDDLQYQQDLNRLRDSYATPYQRPPC